MKEGWVVSIAGSSQIGMDDSLVTLRVNRLLNLDTKEKQDAFYGGLPKSFKPTTKEQAIRQFEALDKAGAHVALHKSSGGFLTVKLQDGGISGLVCSGFVRYMLDEDYWTDDMQYCLAGSNAWFPLYYIKDQLGSGKSEQQMTAQKRIIYNTNLTHQEVEVKAEEPLPNESDNNTEIRIHKPSIKIAATNRHQETRADLLPFAAILAAIGTLICSYLIYDSFGLIAAAISTTVFPVAWLVAPIYFLVSDGSWLPLLLCYAPVVVVINERSVGYAIIAFTALVWFAVEHAPNEPTMYWVCTLEGAQGISNDVAARAVLQSCAAKYSNLGEAKKRIPLLGARNANECIVRNSKNTYGAVAPNMIRRACFALYEPVKKKPNPFSDPDFGKNKRNDIEAFLNAK